MPPPPSRPPSSSSHLGAFLRHAFSPPVHGEDYSIPHALVSVDMLILFAAIACGAGGTLTAINNMGQIGQSLGYPPETMDAFISLISVWNYAGRVAAGYASESLLARYRFPRPLALRAVLLASCAGHLLIAFGAPGGRALRGVGARRLLLRRTMAAALRRHLRAVRAQNA
ncbi:unnamed protein product [Miscanthus lutarioriparius]|uniref:Uncharacterized protein n=1 Tax=Miscanthus lutarioriparius TaxID=422564 RepID=A0A811SKF4_9POAL|nr:unnamed protein product [Miscanthus lutarioriparius]